jgi:hypothetical protein
MTRRTLPDLRRLRRLYFFIFGALCFAVLMWGIFVWSHWMADNDKADFAEVCETLDAKFVTPGDRWLCVRDGEVVYP